MQLTFIIEHWAIWPIVILFSLVMLIASICVVVIFGLFLVSMQNIVEELAPYEDEEDFLEVAQEKVKQKDASPL